MLGYPYFFLDFKKTITRLKRSPNVGQVGSSQYPQVINGPLFHIAMDSGPCLSIVLVYLK